MDTDYENFVGRMGSSEEVVDLDVDEIDVEPLIIDDDTVKSLLRSIGDNVI